MITDILQIDNLLKHEECEGLILKAEIRGFARARFERKGE